MKRILALMLALCMMGALVGCGSSIRNLDDIKENGTIIMGTNAAFPPYEYTEGGKIVGIDAEIAEAVAKEMGVKLEIKDMAFDSLITAVSSGSVDFVMAGMTVTEERKQSVNFSDSYATGIQVVIVTEDSAIASIDDLGDKKIGVQTGTTGDIYCTDDYGEDAISRYNNGALAVQALLNGQIDCVVIDNEPAKAFVAANAGLKILDTEYVTEDYAAAFNKENSDLVNEFNKALKKLQDNGTIDKIVAKYIKAE